MKSQNGQTYFKNLATFALQDFQSMSDHFGTFRVYSRKLGQRPILAKKGTFFENKGTINFTTYSNLFFSFLHQNKAYGNFHKRGQDSKSRRCFCLD